MKLCYTLVWAFLLANTAASFSLKTLTKKILFANTKPESKSSNRARKIRGAAKSFEEDLELTVKVIMGKVALQNVDEEDNDEEMEEETVTPMASTLATNQFVSVPKDDFAIQTLPDDVNTRSETEEPMLASKDESAVPAFQALAVAGSVDEPQNNDESVAVGMEINGEVLSASQQQPQQTQQPESTTDSKNDETNQVATSSLNPSWRDIFEIPISVDTQQQFDSIPLAKRIALVCRPSVLHLTIASCLGPLIVRGCLRSALPAPQMAAMALTPWLAALFTLDGLSWHAVHNLLNDWQDLDDDDDVEDSFRLAYGCHALKQGFVSKPRFLQLMALVGVPGMALTWAFRNTVLAPAALYGIVALFFYTILFKPLALGEIVIYLVWGPLMAGFGQLAAGVPWTGPAQLFKDPLVALFGLAAFGMIMGKHTDKITRSRKRTLPKVLGFPAALWGCGFSVLAPHLLLAATFLKERVFCRATSTPSIPLSAGLAFVTLFREVPACLKVLRLGPPKDNLAPTLPWGTKVKGTIIDGDVDQAWPLWFVAFCGWHAVTFAYLLILGSGAEWMVRAAFNNLF